MAKKPVKKPVKKYAPKGPYKETKNMRSDGSSKHYTEQGKLYPKSTWKAPVKKKAATKKVKPKAKKKK